MSAMKKRVALVLSLIGVFMTLSAGAALAGGTTFSNALVPRYGWHTVDRYDADGGSIAVTLDYPAHGTDARLVRCESRAVVGQKGAFPDEKLTTRQLASADQIDKYECFELQLASRTLARYDVNGFIDGVDISRS